MTCLLRLVLESAGGSYSSGIPLFADASIRCWPENLGRQVDHAERQRHLDNG